MDIRIRIADTADIPVLKNLYQELEKDGVKYQPEHFVLSERNDGYFIDIFRNDNQDILAAEKDGKVIGFSHVIILNQKNISCLRPQKYVYIQDLDVDESERSQGIGRVLMDASKDYGKKHGADFIRTQVFPKNTAGMRFYRKQGFTEMMKTIECQL